MSAALSKDKEGRLMETAVQRQQLKWSDQESYAFAPHSDNLKPSQTQDCHHNPRITEVDGVPAEKALWLRIGVSLSLSFLRIIFLCDSR